MNSIVAVVLFLSHCLRATVCVCLCMCGRWLRCGLGLWLWPRRRKTAHEKNLFSVQWLCFVVLFVCWTSNRANTHLFCLFACCLCLCLSLSPRHSAASLKSECCCCCFLHLCNITTTSGRNVVFGRKLNWTFTFCLNALFVHLTCIVVFLLITNDKYRQNYVCVCVCVHYVKDASSVAIFKRGSTGALAGQPFFTFSLSKSLWEREREWQTHAEAGWATILTRMQLEEFRCISHSLILSECLSLCLTWRVRRTRRGRWS